MSQPTNQERTLQFVASRLTNGALAQRLGIIRDNIRSLSKLERDAYLNEAIRRLQWSDDYNAHLQDKWDRECAEAAANGEFVEDR